MGRRLANPGDTLSTAHGSPLGAQRCASADMRYRAGPLDMADEQLMDIAYLYNFQPVTHAVLYYL